MRIDFIPGRSRSTSRTAAHPQRGRRRRVFELESLEGRIVLSHVIVHQAPSAARQAAIASHAAASEAARQAELQSLANRRADVQQAATLPSAATLSMLGLVTKVPAFNDLYTGPKRSDLNVEAASVRFVPASGFILTAQMVGRINLKPATQGDQSFYVFAIDRGSPNAVAPFSNHPNVFLDATVTVSVLRGGVSIGVRDLVRPDSTTTRFLPSKDVRFAGNRVRVTVPTSMLPIPDGGLPISQYQFSMYPANGINFSSQTLIDSSIASYIPADSEAPIGVPRGFTG
jgi:hypothetical protein